MEMHGVASPIEPQAAAVLHLRRGALRGQYAVQLRGQAMYGHILRLVVLRLARPARGTLPRLRGEKAAGAAASQLHADRLVAGHGHGLKQQIAV